MRLVQADVVQKQCQRRFLLHHKEAEARYVAHVHAPAFGRFFRLFQVNCQVVPPGPEHKLGVEAVTVPASTTGTGPFHTV